MLLLFTPSLSYPEIIGVMSSTTSLIRSESMTQKSDQKDWRLPSLRPPLVASEKVQLPSADYESNLLQAMQKSGDQRCINVHQHPGNLNTVTAIMNLIYLINA